VGARGATGSRCQNLRIQEAVNFSGASGSIPPTCLTPRNPWNFCLSSSPSTIRLGKHYGVYHYRFY